MNKITILGLLKDREAILDRLQELGLLQPELALPEQISEEKAAQLLKVSPELRERRLYLSEKMQELERAIKELHRRYPETKTKVKYPQISYQDIERVRADQDRVITRLNEYEDILDHERRAQAEIDEIKREEELLEAWAGVEYDPDITETAQTLLQAGSFKDEASYQEQSRRLAEVLPHAAFVPLKTAGTEVLVVAIALKRDAAAFRMFLAQSDFRPLQTAEANGVPQIRLDNLARRHAIIKEESKVLDKSLHNLASEEVFNFMLLYEAYSMEDERLAAEADLVQTEQIFCLQGWVAQKRTAKLQENLKKDFPLAFEVRPGTPEDNPPVQLSNNIFSKPFEVLLYMFGAPDARELDPTAIMSVFNFLLFGMMLSDIGYGLVLTIGSIILLKKRIMRGDGERMLSMLYLCGISATIWGFVFGGFFGNFLDKLTNGALHVPALWFNPLEDPMRLMAFSVFFGLIHLFFGMGIKMANSIRNNDTFGAVTQVLPWYFILTGGMLLLLGVFQNNAVVSEIGKWMAIVGAVVVLLFAGRGIKNPLKRLVKGLGSLYGITSYVSDLFSYTRILALALATAVIALVFNEIGTMLGNGVGGKIFFLLVGLLGHTLNLALSTLSAYVHSTRLEYVEFFGKFYESGGRFFKPLERKTRYTSLEEPKELKRAELKSSK